MNITRINSQLKYPTPMQAGFTVVELLIVIVVIAILAAISIISYNGIQKRADIVRTMETIDAYSKAFEIYYAEHGTYPNLGSGCLGSPEDYPASGAFPVNACVVSSSSTSSYNASLNQALSAYMSPPRARLDPVRVDFGGGMIYNYRGVWIATSGTDYEMQYWLPGNQPCPKGERTYNSAAQATKCNLYWGAFS